MRTHTQQDPRSPVLGRSGWARGPRFTSECCWGAGAAETSPVSLSSPEALLVSCSWSWQQLRALSQGDPEFGPLPKSHVSTGAAHPSHVDSSPA